MGHNRSKELGHKTKPIREQCEEIRNVELWEGDEGWDAIQGVMKGERSEEE